MAQFVLEICKGGSWVPVYEGMAIQPQTIGDAIRLTLNRPASGNCVVRIKNGPKMRRPILGAPGTTQVGLGEAGEYVPGSFSVYLGQGGFESEEVLFSMAEPGKGSEPGPGTVTKSDDTSLTESEYVPVPELSESERERLRQLEEESARNEELKAQYEKLKNDYETLQEASRKLEEGYGELAGLVAAKGDIDLAITAQKEENARADEQRKSLLGEYNQLQFDIDDNRMSVQERERQLKELEDKLKELQPRIEARQAELTEKSTELEAIQNSLAKNEAELEHLRGAHTDAEKSLQELVDKRAQLGMKDQEIAEAEARLEEKKTKLKELQTETEKISGTVSGLEKELTTQQARYDVMEEELGKKKTRIQEKETELEDCRTKLRKLETEYSQSINDIRDRLNTLYKECGLIDKQSEDINESMAIVEKAAEDPEFVSCVDDIHGLEERMKSIRADLTEVMTIYRDTLKKLEKQQG